MEKRVFLAIFLSFVVLAVYQAIFPPTPRSRRRRPWAARPPRRRTRMRPPLPPAARCREARPRRRPPPRLRPRRCPRRSWPTRPPATSWSTPTRCTRYSRPQAATLKQLGAEALPRGRQAPRSRALRAARDVSPAIHAGDRRSGDFENAGDGAVQAEHATGCRSARRPGRSTFEYRDASGRDGAQDVLLPAGGQVLRARRWKRRST